MKFLRFKFWAPVFCALFVLTLQPSTGRTANLENLIYLDLKDGRVVIELWPDLAPKHVERIKTLARQKFYDGVVFHRVIEGFMAQTGDPTGTGRGGSELPDLPAEFNSSFHVEGTLSMARSGDPDSANSQFFICFAPAPFLDGQYTAWGKVIEGMEFVHNIKKGDGNRNGSVDNPDKIIKMRVAADVEKKAK
ncbi:MAG: peptidylprolyl isomerase [Rhodospirillaceae bacterium]|nr:peptidylprolyl isomerase [Rhodospirillaceae bacterium]HAA91589.1 peptidylprolyl isomerase [Rhodospirillaceae bacterium]